MPPGRPVRLRADRIRDRPRRPRAARFPARPSASRRRAVSSIMPPDGGFRSAAPHRARPVVDRGEQGARVVGPAVVEGHLDRLAASDSGRQRIPGERRPGGMTAAVPGAGRDLADEMHQFVGAGAEDDLIGGDSRSRREGVRQGPRVDVRVAVEVIAEIPDGLDGFGRRRVRALVQVEQSHLVDVYVGRRLRPFVGRDAPNARTKPGLRIPCRGPSAPSCFPCPIRPAVNPGVPETAMISADSALGPVPPSGGRRRHPLSPPFRAPGSATMRRPFAARIRRLCRGGVGDDGFGTITVAEQIVDEPARPDARRSGGRVPPGTRSSRQVPRRRRAAMYRLRSPASKQNWGLDEVGSGIEFPPQALRGSSRRPAPRACRSRPRGRAEPPRSRGRTAACPYRACAWRSERCPPRRDPEPPWLPVRRR